MENNENGNVYGGVNLAENPTEFKPAGVPTKISTWSKIRNFLFKEIVVTMTPKQEKVFKEVRDFWTQEIYFDNGFHLRPNRFNNPEQLQEVNISL